MSSHTEILGRLKKLTEKLKNYADKRQEENAAMDAALQELEQVIDSKFASEE